MCWWDCRMPRKYMRKHSKTPSPNTASSLLIINSFLEIWISELMLHTLMLLPKYNNMNNFKIRTMIMRHVGYYRNYLPKNSYSKSSTLIHVYRTIRKVVLISYLLINMVICNYYMIDNNSTVYDTSKKKRTPSWCDRILLQCKEETIFQ